jgi:hypothetical protein
MVGIHALTLQTNHLYIELLPINRSISFSAIDGLQRQHSMQVNLQRGILLENRNYFHTD